MFDAVAKLVAFSRQNAAAVERDDLNPPIAGASSGRRKTSEMLACNAGMFAWCLPGGRRRWDDVGTSPERRGTGDCAMGGVGVGDGDVTTFRSRCKAGFRGTTAKLAGQDIVASRSRLTETEIRF